MEYIYKAMKKILAAALAIALIAAPLLSVPAYAEDAQEPITLTVFRGDPGDQRESISASP